MNAQLPEKNISRSEKYFKKVGLWLEKIGVPASAYIDKIYQRWLAPINEQSHDWISDADWARVQQEPLRARLLLNSIAIVFLILLVWAAFAKVDEVARGEGKVIPSQQLQVIQSFDGGVVKEILVHEGDVVNKGDLLVRIDPTRFVSSFRENNASLVSLEARAARLRALTANLPLDMPEEIIKSAPDIAEHERTLYEANRRELDEQLSISRSQLEQRQRELQEVRAKLSQVTRALELANQELTVTTPLLKSGAVSEVEILKLQGEVSNAQGARQQALAQEQRLLAAVQESEGKVREVELNEMNKWRTELSETLAKLSSLSETGTGLADKIKYSEIRAPVHGTVQKLYTNTLGGVVQPGHEVIEIIPLDDQLLIEAKVAPKDIAFLHPGETAIVKFTAYDFAVYGGLTGKLEHISADTMKDDKDNVFYLVRVRTERSGFDASLPIMPGMTAQVDILTGKKTVLSYLLKPVLRAKQNALTER
ncbi:HlyD family type I secretion periplasmic adaptor subunit [Cellvibrio zantedeschiae]|uniref:Membrane fusion protein (MFP) family protein n=1 Tax=Cellvibrio zantedeschiae TaxID=1237077 RepID=A0ABQ3AVQ5_9GAMM|nr:HlyD family type I secretion periplasmic adaptor subunit [Cellvibrio zantedeschiae]GGY69409.1 HlyD family type I secretion periplasmic adaptor subunit [Cellvibrio zantedeschiae]